MKLTFSACSVPNCCGKIIRPARGQVTLGEVGEVGFILRERPQMSSCSKFWAPGKRGYRAFIGDCGQSGSKGCADCWSVGLNWGSGAALGGDSSAGSRWREACLQKQKRLVISSSQWDFWLSLALSIYWGLLWVIFLFIMTVLCLNNAKTC